MSGQSIPLERLGKKIREFRGKHRLSQEQFTAKLQLLGWDICRSTYAKIEDGKRKLRPSELKIIAAVCGVPEEELLNFG